MSTSLLQSETTRNGGSARIEKKSFNPSKRSELKRLQRAALVTSLADKLRSEGSWCGETHLQKATFFLQALLNVPFEFEFILYKHGPFSFDFRDELTALRADGLFDLRRQHPYGASYASTESAGRLRTLYQQTLEEYEADLDLVARQLGPMRVVELERFATALYVSLNKWDSSIDDRAVALMSEKPHISDVEARRALCMLDQFRLESADRSALSRKHG